MPRIKIDDCNINYEEYGQGEPMILVPGVRNGLFSLRPMAIAMSSKYRVIIYDRRNCGASDLRFSGDASEMEIWARELGNVMQALDAWPAHVFGVSIGAGVSMLHAVLQASYIKTLCLSWITGGNYPKEVLGQTMYGQYIDAAQTGGMKAVAEMPFFVERFAENPSGRRYILSLPQDEFLETMIRWRAEFTKPSPIVPVKTQDIKVEKPVLIIAGDDAIHLEESARSLHKLLPNAQYSDPLLSQKEWEALGNHVKIAEFRGKHVPPVYFNFLNSL